MYFYVYWVINLKQHDIRNNIFSRTLTNRFNNYRLKVHSRINNYETVIGSNYAAA